MLYTYGATSVKSGLPFFFFKVDLDLFLRFLI